MIIIIIITNLLYDLSQNRAIQQYHLYLQNTVYITPMFKKNHQVLKLIKYLSEKKNV